MDTADHIAHCAMMLDQARDLKAAGRMNEARERAHSARAEAERAREGADAAHRHQAEEVVASAEAMLKQLG